MELAERGFRETAREDTVLNYQFRILKAELEGRQKPDDALRLLDPAPPPELASGEFAARRKIVQGLAWTYQRNFLAAERCFEEGRQLAADGKPELLAQIAYLQGYLASASGKGVPEDYYRQAIKLAQQYRTPSVEVDALARLGSMEVDRERYDEAISLFQNALDGSRQLHATFTEQFSLGNLGWSYYQLGDFDRSISLLTQAQSAAEAAHESKFEALWATDLGNVYLDLNDYEKAAKYYSAAHTLAVSLNDSDGATLSLHNLTQLELKRDNLEKAEEYNRQALTSAKGAADTQVQFLCMLSTAEIDVRLKQFSKAKQLLGTITRSAKDSSLLWRAQSDLANLYASEGKTREANLVFQAAIRTVENARSVIQREERRMSILDAWPFYDDYIRFLIHQNNAGKALQIAEFSRARTLAEGLGIVGSKRHAEVSIQRMQGFLRKQHDTILAYWLADDESYLWVLTASQFRTFRLPSKQKIEPEIRQYSAKLLDHHGIEDSDNGQKLYELLVRPAEKFIAKGSTVIIIPNRSLYKLNFETLVVPGAKPHYWIEDVTLEVAGSMGLLSRAAQRRSAVAKKLLLIGAPLQASNEFPVLTHADEEIQKVEAHFPPAQETVISGKDATPAAYNSMPAKSFEYIHFVTHGKPSDTNPLDSAIILSPQSDNSFKLYARDIVNTQLNANVVTISACYGAGTKMYSGEGLVGLAWAFLRAGAHHVVAGLWEVDDRATPELMDNFYTGLRDQSVATALRAAKLKMVHAKSVYRLPYYWASLQLYVGS